MFTLEVAFSDFFGENIFAKMPFFDNFIKNSTVQDIFDIIY